MSHPDISRHSEARFQDAAASYRSHGLIRELFRFLGANKKWWLLPVIVAVLMMAATVYLSTSAPFIYSLF
jgi:uncharacterized membrane protein